MASHLGMDPERVEQVRSRTAGSFSLIENAADRARQAAWMSLNPLSYAIQPGGFVIAPYSIASTQLAAALAESAVRDAEALFARLGIEIAQQIETSRAGSHTGVAIPRSSRISVPAVGTSAAEVAAWWAALSPEDQQQLLKDHPDLLGSLDGLPASVRVEANRNRVPDLIADAEAQLAKLKHSDEDDAADRRKFYENEIAYLRQVEQGHVQLYLYDRENSRIIEMIGTPGKDTERVITYVPGTFTGMNSFFAGDTQQVGKYLSEALDGTVVFVYKDGLFPGEAHGSAAGPDMLRITEANDTEYARTAGEQLARFEVGMRTDPALGGVPQHALGHSWGLANVTSSEVAGAQYDTVISLAGAGMLEDWQARDGTTYANLYYYDILVHAQTRRSFNPFNDWGPVWGGNNPIYSEDFSQNYYKGPNDDQLKGAMNTKRELDVLTENHSLIATRKTENQKALDDMMKLLK